MESPEYVILQRLPTAQEYYDLRKVADLSLPPIEAAAKSLPNSVACFVAYQGNAMVDDTTPDPAQHPIAMGRLVGDGALFLQVVDVAVHPDHQRKGLGKRILGKLIDFADEHAPGSCLSLVADPPGRKLYPKFGFKGTEPSVAMFRCEWMREVHNRKLNGMTKVQEEGVLDLGEGETSGR